MILNSEITLEALITVKDKVIISATMDNENVSIMPSSPPPPKWTSSFKIRDLWGASEVELFVT